MASLSPSPYLKTTISNLSHTFNSLRTRITSDPGLPHPNPTASYWQSPPHPLSTIQSPPTLPTSTDIVIIGSGISALSAAYTLLSSSTTSTSSSPNLRILVLEARTLSSGATGRNGGHIKASTYMEYPALKKRFGKDRARRIVEFRRRHLQELGRIARKEGVLERCELEEVESVDVFFDQKTWGKNKAYLKEYLGDGGDGGGEDQNGGGNKWEYSVFEGAEARKKFAIHQTVGCITYPAGSFAPYTFTTHLWENLLSRNPWATNTTNTTSYPPSPSQPHHQLSIQTRTPCTSISSPDPVSGVYTITTPRGAIAAQHIIHCTNAHSSHLVPGIRGKIYPLRAQMTAQTLPRVSPYSVNPYLADMTNSVLNGGDHKRKKKRSWVFMYEKGFDYLTLRPSNSFGEDVFMIGGGVSLCGENGFGEFGVADDGVRDPETGIGGPDFRIAAYLGGVLSWIFRGGDGEIERDKGEGGRVVSHWTGSIALSADEVPFVGKLWEAITGRKEVVANGEGSGQGGGGEWIAAGYTGEGMVNAWGCGVALGAMLLKELGRDVNGCRRNDEGESWFDMASWESWFPREFFITPERLENADEMEIVDYYNS